jgi:hypothetical protein
MNDLIGLKRAWGAKPGDGSGTVDCCLLFAEVRKRLGYYDWTPDMLPYFDKYTDDTFPRLHMLRWLLKNGTKLDGPECHAVVLLPGANGGAMGTVMDDGRVLFISQRNGVVIAPIAAGTGHYFRLNK